MFCGGHTSQPHRMKPLFLLTAPHEQRGAQLLWIAHAFLPFCNTTAQQKQHQSDLRYILALDHLTFLQTWYTSPGDTDVRTLIHNMSTHKDINFIQERITWHIITDLSQHRNHQSPCIETSYSLPYFGKGVPEGRWHGLCRIFLWNKTTKPARSFRKVQKTMHKILKHGINHVPELCTGISKVAASDGSMRHCFRPGFPCPKHPEGTNCSRSEVPDNIPRSDARFWLRQEDK